VLEEQKEKAVFSFLIGMLILLSVTSPLRADDVVLPLPAEDQKTIDALLGPGVVGKALPSKPIQDASVYFPLADRALTYKVTSGKNAGKTQTLDVAQVERPGGKRAWRVQLSPSLNGFIRLTPDGDLTMPAVSDSGEGLVVFTTPANPFMPQGMQPGETRTYSQKVSVNYLDDPTDQDYAGTLDGSYTYLGTYQVTVPAGTFDAVLLRVKCAGKVGPAHTHNTVYNLFAPRVGTVAMIMQEDVKAFWIFNIDSATGKVLTAR
jgi:hypothetical protein